MQTAPEACCSKLGLYTCFKVDASLLQVFINLVKQIPMKISFYCFYFPLRNNMGHENTLPSWWNHSFLLQRKLMVKLLPLTFNYKVETRILPTFPRYGYICKCAFSYTSTLGVVLPAVVRMLCIYPLHCTVKPRFWHAKF